MDTDVGRLSQNGIIQKTPGGLNRDEADWTSLRWNGAEHHGWQYGRHYQSVPMFFTAEGHNLWLGDHYRGRSLFITSGGPSLAKTDLSALKQPGFVSMGINNSPRIFRPNLWVSVDSPSSFMRSIWLDPAITKFNPICSVDKTIFDNDSIVQRDEAGAIIRGPDGAPVYQDDKGMFLKRTWEKTPGPLRVRDCPAMVYYRRNEHFRASQFLWEDTINWGNHGDLGGARSVFLVALRLGYLLGFRRIFLLGVDFKMTTAAGYAFPQARSASSVRHNNGTYETLQKRCTELQPLFLNEGYEVFNCNPDSALTAFPHKPLNEAVKLVTDEFWCGGTPIDVSKENTEGLYDREDRMKAQAGTKLEQGLKDAKEKAKGAIAAAVEKKGGKKPKPSKGSTVEQPEGDHPEYPQEERIEVKMRLDAARDLLHAKKAEVKATLEAEPKDATDDELKAWTDKLKLLQSDEEQIRELFRTIEDEKRWKHGEDIRWGLWSPEEGAPV